MHTSITVKTTCLHDHLFMSHQAMKLLCINPNICFLQYYTYIAGVLVEKLEVTHIKPSGLLARLMMLC